MQRRGIFFLFLVCAALFLFQRWEMSRLHSSPAFEISQIPFPLTVPEKMLLGIPLSVNRLSAEEWKNLPHIGSATAKKIVEHRLRSGDFHTLEDLQNVRGIGPKTLEWARPFLTVTSSKF